MHCAVCMHLLYVHSGVTNLINTTFSLNLITVTWNLASSSYCGEVLYYQVVISSNEHCEIMNNTIRATNLSATFSALRSNTTYTIAVSAVNRARLGSSEMVNITTAMSTGYSVLSTCINKLCTLP